MGISPEELAAMFAALSGTTARSPETAKAAGAANNAAQSALSAKYQEDLEKQQEDDDILGKILGVAAVIPGPQQPFIATASTVYNGAKAFDNGDAAGGVGNVVKAAGGFAGGGDVSAQDKLNPATVEPNKIQTGTQPVAAPAPPALLARPQETDPAAQPADGNVIQQLIGNVDQSGQDILGAIGKQALLSSFSELLRPKNTTVNAPAFHTQSAGQTLEQRIAPVDQSGIDPNSPRGFFNKARTQLADNLDQQTNRDAFVQELSALLGNFTQGGSSRPTAPLYLDPAIASQLREEFAARERATAEAAREDRRLGLEEERVGIQRQGLELQRDELASREQIATADREAADRRMLLGNQFELGKFLLGESSEQDRFDKGLTFEKEQQEFDRATREKIAAISAGASIKAARIAAANRDQVKPIRELFVNQTTGEVNIVDVAPNGSTSVKGIKREDGTPFTIKDLSAELNGSEEKVLATWVDVDINKNIIGYKLDKAKLFLASPDAQKMPALSVVARILVNQEPATPVKSDPVVVDLSSPNASVFGVTEKKQGTN